MHRRSTAECGRCLTRFACQPDRLPSSGITRHPWYFTVIRLPKRHLPRLLLQLLGHTRIVVIGFHDRFKNLWVSLVALKTCCVTRVDLRLRDSCDRSPRRDRKRGLQVCKDLRQYPTVTMLSELNLIQGLTASQYLSPSLPFCLRFNVGLRRDALYQRCKTRY